MAAAAAATGAACAVTCAEAVGGGDQSMPSTGVPSLGSVLSDSTWTGV